MERLFSNHEKLLADLIKRFGVGNDGSAIDSPDLGELAANGYLLKYEPFMDGTCEFVVGGKCAAYFEELEREEASERDAKRHEWALNLVNGVYLVVGMVLGVIAGIAATWFAS